MAGAEGGDRSFNPRAHQLKLSLNLPASIDVSRSLGELQSVAQEIQRQKNELLCQLKYEDKDRHSYFSQLEHLARQMRELPLPTDSPSMEYELERKRLELETQRMQETMLKTLGTTSEVVRRREERISLLRKLDQQLTEIESLIASKNQAAVEAAAAADIWLSGSSLELHLEEKNGIHSDTASVMSFTSSIHSSGGATQLKQQQQPSQQINMAPAAVPVAGPKVEVVYNLLTMLFSHDRQNVSQKLLHMSTSPETRNTLHQVGCIPLLVQLIYNQDGDGGSSFHQQGSDQSASSNSQQHWILSSADKESRSCAAQALHNLVYSGGDERKVKREVRILKLLDLVRGYADGLREAIVTRYPNTDDLLNHCNDHPLLPDDDPEVHPCGVVTNLMKLSFDEDHRHAMSQLGALQGLCEVLHMDQLAHGPLSEDQQCTTLRRYASMTLTNLTFGHGPNKALLCSTRPLLAVLSLQLRSPNDDLRQVTASVLRNLSWRADGPSKEALQKSSVVASLVAVAMETHRESTLKSMLSALWNLSSHSSNNKAAICSAPGALEFLVRTLNYKSESKTLSVVESGGGVLRNVSSHIATRSDYRATLRQNGCFNILLHQLRSPSLTVVSNACGTLWNLSARCPQDQTLLRELGAVPMLRSLIHSRHKMIAQASQAALKNLEASAVNGGGGSNLPSPLTGHPSPSPQSQSSSSSLQARKQKALEQEIDQTLTEMCDHMDPLSPLDDQPNPFDRSRMYRSLGGHNNTVYGRSRSSLAPPTSSLALGSRQQRSSSLERNKQQLPQPLTPTVPSPSSRLQVSRTAWRSHETNEISYTSLNYEEDDQPVNYSLKYTEVVKTAASSSSAADVVSRSVSKSSVGQMESSEVTTTVKKALVLSAYRETDLEEPTEQPTDFSLRYGDPDDDEEDYDASDTMQTYCMEGTPYETPFTRSSAASLTDLREAGKSSSNKPMKREEEEEDQEDQEGGQTPPPRGSSKTVTFNEESSNGGGVGTNNSTVNFAEQTPLMFSRSSSMASLDSLDQLDGQGNSHQQHDEGSVLSEFSRLTSRAVSPSDLPDSPGQTMPSSPRHQRSLNGKKPLTPPPREQQQQPDTITTKQQQQADVFEDSTNAFGIEEGQTPAFGTRAASPLSQLSFDDEPSSPSPAPLPPVAAAAPPVLAGSRAPMPLPVNSPAAPSPQMPLVRPDLSRVVKSTSEVNFRNHFDYDESRHFNEEDSPALTRCTSLSSLHIDGEVISTAKKILRREEEQPMATAMTERKTVDPPVVAKAPQAQQQQQPPQVHSVEWSEEESGSEDDLLLEDIITLGRQPTGAKGKAGSQQKQQKPPPPPQRTSSTSLSKSASAHSLQLASSSSPAVTTAPCSVPVSRSNMDFTSTTKEASESVEASDDDDEMLYACIKSAKPKAKPVPPPRTSSIKSSSSSSLPSIAQQQQQRSRQPMSLPASSSNNRPPAAPTPRDPLRVPPLHGPYANIRQMATIQQQQQHRHNTRSSSEVRSSVSSSNGPSVSGAVSRRRSRHSSQGSSRLGASGSSNNTSSSGGLQSSTATIAATNGTPGRGEADYRYSYKVEDTPVTFSRNSSLSSLSVNSNDDEPSAEDQALLDSCISWGMPPKASKHSAPPQQKKLQQPQQQQQEQHQSESKNCWAGAGVRRAGDGQAASATSSAASTSSVATGKSGTSSVIDLTDVVVKMEDPPVPELNSAPVHPLPEQLEGYPSMTHSSLIRLEANQVAAQIAAGQQQQQQQQSASSYFPCSNNLNDLNGDPYSSLLSPSFIDVATSSWPSGSPTPSRKTSQQQQLQQPASPLLKRALSSSLGQSSLSESSSLMMTCSVLDPNYFDDEQRRQGLLGQLAAMERLAIDENANSSPATTPPPVKGDHTEDSPSNNSINTSPQGDRRKLTPRDRRQADKDRYQTYTLNANPPTANNDAKDEHKRNRRSGEPERFKTQTISPISMQTATTTMAAAAEEGQVDLDVLEADARAVIHTLKQEQLSRKNSNSSELLDCETLSLVSNESEPSDRSLNVKRMGTTNGGGAVRIIRPDDKTMHNPSLQEDDAAVKGIRGRRRVLYPVRVAPTNNAPAPSIVNNRNVSSKVTTTSRNSRSASPASPSPVRPNRTSALRQNNSSSQQQRAKCPSAPALESQSRLRVSSKSPRVNSAPCSPRQPPIQSQQQLNRRSLEMTGTTKITNGNSVVKPGAAVDPAHPPLASIGKQGTFTKETSVSPPSAAAIVGGVKVESDDHDQFDAMKVPPKVPPKPKPSTAPKPVLPKKPARFPNGSGGGTGHNGGPSPLSSPRSSNKSAGSPALSRRSVSSASIGSDSTSVATAYSSASASADEPLKRTPPKKVVASKIASLWKQVEDSRSKQKTAEQQPDGRKWIATKAATTVVPSSSQTAAATPPRPIVSSSTFEKLSSFTDGPPVPFPTSETKRSPPSRLPFRLPRFGRNGSSSSSSPVTTPTLPTPPSPSGPLQPTSVANAIDVASDLDDKRKFRVTAL